MPAVYAKIDETWSAQLNVENIFNKGYWASADGNNNISPGQGRTVAGDGEGEVLRSVIIASRRVANAQMRPAKHPCIE